MRVSFLFSLLTVFILGGVSVVAAQEKAPPVVMPVPERGGVQRIPGQGMIPPKPMVTKSYADSVEFNKEFEAFYPAIQPKVSMMDHVEKQFTQTYPRFKSRGVDSVQAWEAVLKNVDTLHTKELAYVTYREIFTAAELKEYTKFLTTPAGKKMRDNAGRLTALPNEEQGYVMRVVNASIMPLAKAQDPQGRGQMAPPPGSQPSTPAPSNIH